MAPDRATSATPSTEIPTAEERARHRARALTGLMWHAGSFLIVNAWFWVLDAGLGTSAFDWAYWITGAWGFALAFHGLAYWIEGRDVEHRLTRRYLHEHDRHRIGHA